MLAPFISKGLFLSQPRPLATGFEFTTNLKKKQEPSLFSFIGTFHLKESIASFIKAVYIISWYTFHAAALFSFHF